MNIEYYFAHDGRQVGPVSADQLRREGVTPQTLVWRKGLAAWTAAGQLPELLAIFAQHPPPLPTVAAVMPAGQVTAVAKAPWNPTTIGLLSIAFTALWGGIMAAVNARRLGMSTPWWRPVGIGGAYVLLDGLSESWFGDSYFVALVLHLGTVGVLWALDLAEQAKRFAAKDAGVGTQSAWLWPGLAGAPLGLLIVTYFVIMPLAPLQPREVCRRLMDAQTEAEYKKYATLRLQPALAALSKFDDGSDAEYELLGEEETSAGGRIIGFHAVGKDGTGTIGMDGYFLVLELDEGWRVDELYIAGFNGETLAEPLPLSTSYQQLTFAAGVGQLQQPASGRTSTGNTLQNLAKKPTSWPFILRLVIFIGVAGAAWLNSLSGKAKGER